MTLLVLPSVRLQLSAAELWQDEVILHLTLQPNDDAVASFDVDYWGRELILEIRAGNAQLTETTRSVGKVGRRFRIDSYFYDPAQPTIIAEPPTLVARLEDSQTETTINPLTPLADR